MSKNRPGDDEWEERGPGVAGKEGMRTCGKGRRLGFEGGWRIEGENYGTGAVGRTGRLVRLAVRGAVGTDL